MNNADFLAFPALFKEACFKCFGYPLKDPLTETESKLFYNQIFEHTGLTIGWESIKNYSFFVVDDSPGKQEIPSVATLDTLSRYVLKAPYTTEIERNKNEKHYPYWVRYKEQFYRRRRRLIGEEGWGHYIDDTDEEKQDRDADGTGGEGEDRGMGGTRRVAFLSGSALIILFFIIIIFRGCI